MTDDQPMIIPIEALGGGQSQALPQAQRQDRAELLDKIDPSKPVEIIRNRLLGREIKGGVWYDNPALKDNRLSEVGAWEISNLMLGVSTITTSVSSLKDIEIKTRAHAIAKTAQIMLVANWKTYGLRKTSQQHFVHEIIFSNTLMVLKQADKASIQELLKATVQENRNIQSEPRRSGKLRRMLGMGGD